MMNEMLNVVAHMEEKAELAQFFEYYRAKDFLCVFSREEDRTIVEVTEKLFNAGFTSCVDNYQHMLDEDGNLIETKLSIGDFLVLEKAEGTLYSIKRDVFLATHKDKR
jgi:excinuclease UvrABC helicase subunit UvrB